MSEIRDQRYMRFDCELQDEAVTLVMKSPEGGIGHQEELRIRLNDVEVERMASTVDAWREGKKR